MDEVRVDGLRTHTSDAGLSEKVKNTLQNIYGRLIIAGTLHAKALKVTTVQGERLYCNIKAIPGDLTHVPPGLAIIITLFSRHLVIVSL